MRTAMFYGGPDIRVEEMPTPAPGPGEVLVRIGAAGICGSDLHPYRGENPWGGWGGRRPAARRPRAGRHGRGGRLRRDRAGGRPAGRRRADAPGRLRRVPLLPARRLPPLPDARRAARASRPTSAGFSEYDLVVAEERLSRCPDSVSIDAASLLDVYACGVHALNRVPLRPFETVVVIGTGPIGMTAGQVARAAGARQVIMVGRRDELLAVAREVGAADAVVNGAREDVGEAVARLTDGLGAEVVLETVGGHEATMRAGGRGGGARRARSASSARSSATSPWPTPRPIGRS